MDPYKCDFCRMAGFTFHPYQNWWLCHYCYTGVKIAQEKS